MCMSSTGQNTSNSVSEFKPPSYTTDGSLGPGTTWQEYGQRGGQIASEYATDPHLIYGNDGQPMVAQMSDLQNRAANGLFGLASQGNPNDSLANGYLAQAMSGQQQNIQPDNPYMGNSAQFEQMLGASNNDITNNFMRSSMAPESAAAAQAGAYGGSKDTELKTALSKQLNDSIAQNTNQQRNAQYERSSGLAENAINRASGAFENAANRGLSAAQLNNTIGNSDVQRWLSTMGAGDLQQQTQQNNINAAESLHNQNVQQPLQALDIYRTVLAAMSGQGGTSSSSQYGPQQNGLMNALGGGAALYGLLGH